MPVDATIRLHGDAAGKPGEPLAKLLGGATGWVLVRPDRHVAVATTDARELVSAARRAFGW